LNVVDTNDGLVGNSADKLRHPRTDVYSAEQIWGCGAYLHCYHLL